MSGLVVNPFKGLRPFGEADAADFFGRGPNRRRTPPTGERAALHGGRRTSGSGKSSLVLAGLVPELKQDEIPGRPLDPGCGPIRRDGCRVGDIATVDQARTSRRSRYGETGGSDGSRWRAADDDDLVIVIDQLEELWTTTDDDDAALFAASLADLHPHSSCARVVATVRADWFDRPLRDPSLGPLVAAGDVRNHTHGGGASCTRRSASLQRVSASVSKVVSSARMVTEALDQPGSLPLLQFACSPNSSTAGPGATITTEEYDQIGGLTGSVAHQAESLYVKLHVAGPVGDATSVRPPRDGRRRCRGHPPTGSPERAGGRGRPGGERTGRSTPPDDGPRP